MWWILGIVIALILTSMVIAIDESLKVIDCAIVKIERTNNKNPIYCIGIYKDKELVGFLKKRAIDNLISLKDGGYLCRDMNARYLFINETYYTQDTIRADDLNVITEMYNEVRFIMNVEENFVRITPLQDEKSFVKKEETFNKSRELTVKMIEAGKNGDEVLELDLLEQLEKLHNGA